MAVDEAAILTLCFSQDSKQLVSGLVNHTFLIWTKERWWRMVAGLFDGHKNPVWGRGQWRSCQIRNMSYHDRDFVQCRSGM